MFARVLGLAAVGIVIAGVGVGVAGEKGKDKKDTKKEPPKVELKSVSGTVTAIDAEKGTFSLQISEKKAATYTVTDDTKFVGPKGGSRGMGKPGLKDESMAKGAGVRVFFGQDAKVPLEVHLPPRAAGAGSTDTKTPIAKTPDVKTPLAGTPEVVPAPAGVPRVVGATEIGPERVGPVRRMLRRIFR